ncbi:hypothetical protein [Pseudohongiella acticola]|uniref:hypothetical protein n=1 Tax=Pseudohongiella acticola TaxID=1524254 RepID=UPI0030EE8FEB
MADAQHTATGSRTGLTVDSALRCRVVVDVEMNMKYLPEKKFVSGNAVGQIARKKDFMLFILKVKKVRRIKSEFIALPRFVIRYNAAPRLN